jgi:ApaG protein
MSKPEFTCAVAVRPLPEESNTEAGQYAFAYTVTIRNSGDITGQLIARHWIINDSNGHVEEVRGLAVVGHQPVLKPGESFEYTSGTSIPTAVGTMRGTYHMVAEDGLAFDVPIAPFTLSIPRTLH